MTEGIQDIHQKVTAFRRKYYLNLFIKGAVLTITLVLAYLALVSLIEYNLWLGKGVRFLLFTTFFALVAVCVFLFLRAPLAWWIYKRGLGEEQSARMIGHYFPGIGDRLLNVLQLAATSSGSLAQAGIQQKSNAFKNISFEEAINFRDNIKYLKYFGAAIAFILLLMVIDRSIFTQSTKRIIQFNQEFSPQAPFTFQVDNPSLSAFFNEDFTLQLSLKGSSIPESAYIVIGNQRWKMESLGTGQFSYLFEKLQNEVDLQIEAAGFYSDRYKIEIINRPEVTKINVQLAFPSYLGRKAERMTNVGNLEIPEGTKVTWQVGTANATRAKITFSSGLGENEMPMVDDQLFNFSKNIKDPDQYSILLENDKSKNKEQISYSIAVVKDQFPQIVVDNLQDSILFKNILLGGSLTDDYGVTELKLQYQIIKGNKEAPLKTTTIPLNSNRNQQKFFYEWKIDSLKLQPGDKVNYYLQVWDNDGVNGRKSTRSAGYVFALPGDEELKADIAQSQRNAENKIDQSIQKAKDLKQSIDEAQERLKGKQSLDWQDKKMLEELIQQKQKLDQAIQQLQKENSLLEQKKESFTEESERIREKSEQIQKIMDELLDEETKKLFQELEKLLKENADPSQMQKLLDKMDRKEINMEKELERTLELFKQLQYDYKLDQAIAEIKEQKKKQENILEKTQELAGEKPEPKDSKDSKDGKENKDGKQNENNPDKSKDNSGKENDGEKNDDGQNNEKPSAEKLAEEQEQLKKENEQFKETVKELEKMGEELDEGQDTPSEQQMQELEQSQENSKEELKKGKPKKASEQQKKAVEQMKKMQQKLEGMQNSMEMEMDMANLESLRQILHGLIKLSYDQENLMKEFNQVQQTDPRYVTLGQQQLKVKDDAKVLEDSLLSLSKKDAFLGSVVTKEVGELNDHLDKATLNVKERKKGSASSEMQFSMTSINNLALMLNDHFDMMMDMMANAKPGKGKKKGKQQMPNLSQMQQQLNQQMQEMKKGGKSGRQLSEEFARMAAEQERIRRALQEMQEKLKQEGGKLPGGDLPGKMEQTEMDLVNKQITEQTIRRQNEIITRLLEAEKSMREQNQDQERKGETAKDYTQEMPRAFEEYLRLKEKEVELLKTVPPRLFPYYKQEVNEYFKRIGTKE